MESALRSQRGDDARVPARARRRARSVWDARYLPLAAAPGEPPDQLLLVATDVTEQRAAQEARLEAAIAQREMLVKEVHHRIKNNLQGVAGLLQQIAERKPEVAGAIDEVVGQVQAIAQVYGLQVGDDRAAVDGAACSRRSPARCSAPSAGRSSAGVDGAERGRLDACPRPRRSRSR